jgi:hypothetical protein
METNISKMSIVGIDTDISGSGLGLEPWEPFQPSEVLDLRSFTYDRKTDKIIQEQLRKVLATEGMPILVVTHVPVNGYVRDNLIETTIVDIAFMNANEDNI